MIKKYNKQCDVINKFWNERKILQNKINILKNDKIDDKYIIRVLKKKLKILETIQNRTRIVRKLITSFFVLFSLFVNHIAEMIANVNASNQFEKMKQSVVVSNSTIFIENKAKFEHWLAIMQNKLKTNVDWYSIERMTMIYINTKFDEEIYKHISRILNKNFARRYLTINEIFDDLKQMYVDSNKMQIVINAFNRLNQINIYVECHVFWNEFKRFIKKMNLSKHFLLIELKRKMFINCKTSCYLNLILLMIFTS
jgi:translation elongation factor EF-G